MVTEAMIAWRVCGDDDVGGGPVCTPPCMLLTYLLAAVAVLADPDLNLATVIKCETARVRGATVVVPLARSTLAVTNTCPKDGVHLCWHNENERIHTYCRRRLTGRKSLLRLIGPDWFDDVQSTTSFGSVATYFDSCAPRFLWTVFCEKEHERCPREHRARRGPRREPGGRPEWPPPRRRSAARGGGLRAGRCPWSSRSSRGNRSSALVGAMACRRRSSRRGVTTSWPVVRPA